MPSSTTFAQPTRGKLQKNSLAGVLLALYARKSTGLLRLKRDPTQFTLYIYDGPPVWLVAEQRSDSFVAWLMKRRHIDITVYSKLMEAQKRRRTPPQELLVEFGVYDNHTVVDLLRLYITDKIRDCFKWPGGTYEFELGSDRFGEMVLIDIDIGRLLLDGLLSSVDKSTLNQQGITSKARASINDEPPFDTKLLSLTADEQQILKLVQEGMMVGDILRQQPAAARLLGALTLLQVIIFGERRQKRVQQAPPPNMPRTGAPSTASRGTGPPSRLEIEARRRRWHTMDSAGPDPRPLSSAGSPLTRPLSEQFFEESRPGTAGGGTRDWPRRSLHTRPGTDPGTRSSVRGKFLLDYVRLVTLPPHKLLEVAEDANEREIRDAHRNLMQQFKDPRFEEAISDPTQSREARIELMRRVTEIKELINKAYHSLVDPDVDFPERTPIPSYTPPPLPPERKGPDPQQKKKGFFDLFKKK